VGGAIYRPVGGAKYLVAPWGWKKPLGRIYLVRKREKKTGLWALIEKAEIQRREKTGRNPLGRGERWK